VKKLDIFNKDELNRNSIHYSICFFLEEWLRDCYYHTPSYIEALNKIEIDLKNIFAVGYSGFGIQSGGTIYNYYDEEWMPDKNIKPFEDGECFVVDFENTDWKFTSVMYSRSEISGWFSLALERYGKLFPNQKKQLSEMENKYYSPDFEKEYLRKKSLGELEWEYGSCDNY
jgi:hypothetical protein